MGRLLSIFTETTHLNRGSRDGAVVEHLPPTQASHQCGLGSIPGLGVKCGLSLLLVLIVAPRGFSPDSPFFPSPQKSTFPTEFQCDLEFEGHRFVSQIVVLRVTPIK